jgi:RNA polymerase sigma factor (sigma-70 family)
MEQDIHSLTDSELEHFAAGGSREAFGELYERHSGRVYDFLLRMTRDPEEAADLMQETFVRAMKSLSAEKAGGALFSTWLFTIARNLAITRLERRKRTVPLLQDEEERQAEGIDAFHVVDGDRFIDPEEAIGAKETASLVWQAAAALDPKQYSLLDLHVRQGLDSAEIASVLGVSKGNAYTMLSRLKDAFEEAVDSLIMFKRGRRYCAELDRIVTDYRMQELSVSVRKLVSRHTAECATCQEQRRRLVSAEAVLRSLVPLPLPLLLKQRVAEAAMQASPMAAGAAAKAGVVKSLWSQSAGRMLEATAGWKVAIGGALLMAVVGGLTGGLLLAEGEGSPVHQVADIVIEPSPAGTPTPTQTATPIPQPSVVPTEPAPTPPPPPAPPPTPVPLPTALPASCPGVPPFPPIQFPAGYACSEISGAPSGETAGFNTQLEQSEMELENYYRATLNLSPLVRDSRLDQAAKAAAQQLVEAGWIGDDRYPNHITPDGRNEIQRLADVGLVYGQNLYWPAENYYWGMNGANACRIFSGLTELHRRDIAADCLYGAPIGPYYGIGCYFRYAPQLQFVCIVDYAALE